MRLRRSVVLGIALTGLLVGCSANPVRFAVPEVDAGRRISVSVKSIEVREVSLPAYARTEEIWRETPEGALVSDGEVLWADEPTRGVTQEVSRYLAAVTGVRVATEPWPFFDPAAARLEVRVDRMLAGADGRFRLSGQYLSASDSGTRDRDGRFDVTAPIDGDGIQALALARAKAVLAMTRQIAKGL